MAAVSLHDFQRLQERLKSVADPVSFLANLFAHAPVGFGVWTADGHPLLTNEAFMELFRVEPPPEYNVLKDDLLAANGMLALFQRAFAGETVHVPTIWYDPRELELVHVTEGKRVAISVTIFPLFNARGEIEYVAATYKDETEVMLAHERLQELNDNLERTVQARTAQLRSANRELEAFSYTVAHDLRGPLHSMNIFAEILLQEHGHKLGPDGLRHLEQIKGSALLMGRLIEALLSLANLGRRSLEPGPVDLGGFARAAATSLAAGEPERAVEVVVAGPLQATMDSDAGAHADGKPRRQRLEVHPTGAARPRRGRCHASRRRGRVLRARQRRGLRHGVRRPAVQAIPAPAFGMRNSRDRHRPRHLPPHRRSARRPHLGRGSGGRGRHHLLHAAAAELSSCRRAIRSHRLARR